MPDNQPIETQLTALQKFSEQPAIEDADIRNWFIEVTGDNEQALEVAFRGLLVTRPNLAAAINLEYDQLWQFKDTNCKNSDPDLFFPTRRQSSKPAKAICAGCVVKKECLEYAIKHDSPGIWGGTTESERRSIAKKRRKKLEAA